MSSGTDYAKVFRNTFHKMIDYSKSTKIYTDRSADLKKAKSGASFYSQPEEARCILCNYTSSMDAKLIDINEAFMYGLHLTDSVSTGHLYICIPEWQHFPYWWNQIFRAQLKKNTTFQNSQHWHDFQPNLHKKNRKLQSGNNKRDLWEIDLCTR